MLTVYSQQDKICRSIQLDHSIYYMGGSGCAVVSCNNGFRSYGVCDESPDVTINWLNTHNGETADGNIFWTSFDKRWPGVVKYLGQDESDLFKPGNDPRTPIATVIETVKAHLVAGHMVILQVDLSPRNGLNEGDHYVVIPKRPGLEAWNNGDPIIQDAWYGKETTLSAPSGIGDLFMGYGMPEKAIYGYVAFEIKLPNAPAIPLIKRNIALEQVNAQKLHDMLYNGSWFSPPFAAYDVALAYAGGHWFQLVNAMTYYGYSALDLKNWLYSLTHKKVVLNNWDLTKPKT